MGCIGNKQKQKEEISEPQRVQRLAHNDQVQQQEPQQQQQDQKAMIQINKQPIEEEDDYVVSQKQFSILQYEKPQKKGKMMKQISNEEVDLINKGEPIKLSINIEKKLKINFIIQENKKWPEYHHIHIIRGLKFKGKSDIKIMADFKKDREGLTVDMEGVQLQDQVLEGYRALREQALMGLITIDQINDVVQSTEVTLCHLVLEVQDDLGLSLLEIIIIQEMFTLTNALLEQLDIQNQNPIIVSQLSVQFFKSILRQTRRGKNIQKVNEFLKQVSMSEYIACLSQSIQKIFFNINKGYFVNLTKWKDATISVITNINQQSRMQVQFFGRYLKLFKVQEDDGVVSELQKIYKEYKSIEYFRIPRLPKKLQINSKRQQLYLEVLRYNIIHEIVRKKQWGLFLDSFSLDPKWYYEQDTSEHSPYMRFISAAPLDIIDQFHQVIPESEEAISLMETHFNKNGKNIYHCLIENMSFDFGLLLRLMKQIRDFLTEESRVKFINMSWETGQVVPLSLFLDKIRRHFRLKEVCEVTPPMKEIIQFLQEGLVRTFNYEDIIFKAQIIGFIVRLKNQSFQKIKKVISSQQFIFKGLTEQDQQLLDQYLKDMDVFYSNNIKLCLILLKFDEKISEILEEQLPWLEWRAYYSYVPFDMAQSGRNLVDLSLRQGQFNRAKKVIQAFSDDQPFIILKGDEEFLEFFQRMINQYPGSENKLIQKRERSIDRTKRQIEILMKDNLMMKLNQGQLLINCFFEAYNLEQSNQKKELITLIEDKLNKFLNKDANLIITPLMGYGGYSPCGFMEPDVCHITVETILNQIHWCNKKPKLMMQFFLLLYNINSPFERHVGTVSQKFIQILLANAGNSHSNNFLKDEDVLKVIKQFTVISTKEDNDTFPLWFNNFNKNIAMEIIFIWLHEQFCTGEEVTEENEGKAMDLMVYSTIENFVTFLVRIDRPGNNKFGKTPPKQRIQNFIFYIYSFWLKKLTNKYRFIKQFTQVEGQFKLLLNWLGDMKPSEPQLFSEVYRIIFFQIWHQRSIQDKVLLDVASELPLQLSFNLTEIDPSDFTRALLWEMRGIRIVHNVIDSIGYTDSINTKRKHRGYRQLIRDSLQSQKGTIGQTIFELVTIRRVDVLSILVSDEKYLKYLQDYMKCPLNVKQLLGLEQPQHIIRKITIKPINYISLSLAHGAYPTFKYLLLLIQQQKQTSSFYEQYYLSIMEDLISYFIPSWNRPYQYRQLTNPKGLWDVYRQHNRKTVKFIFKDVDSNPRIIYKTKQIPGSKVEYIGILSLQQKDLLNKGIAQLCSALKKYIDQSESYLLGENETEKDQGGVTLFYNKDQSQLLRLISYLDLQSLKEIGFLPWITLLKRGNALYLQQLFRSLSLDKEYQAKDNQVLLDYFLDVVMPELVKMDKEIAITILEQMSWIGKYDLSPQIMKIVKIMEYLIDENEDQRAKLACPLKELLESQLYYPRIGSSKTVDQYLQGLTLDTTFRLIFKYSLFGQQNIVHLYAYYLQHQFWKGLNVLLLYITIKKLRYKQIPPLLSAHLKNQNNCNYIRSFMTHWSLTLNTTQFQQFLQDTKSFISTEQVNFAVVLLCRNWMVDKLKIIIDKCSDNDILLFAIEYSNLRALNDTIIFDLPDQIYMKQQDDWRKDILEQIIDSLQFTDFSQLEVRQRPQTKIDNQQISKKPGVSQFITNEKLPPKIYRSPSFTDKNDKDLINYVDPILKQASRVNNKILQKQQVVDKYFRDQRNTDYQRVLRDTFVNQNITCQFWKPSDTIQNKKLTNEFLHQYLASKDIIKKQTSQQQNSCKNILTSGYILHPNNDLFEKLIIQSPHPEAIIVQIVITLLYLHTTKLKYDHKFLEINALSYQKFIQKFFSSKVIKQLVSNQEVFVNLMVDVIEYFGKKTSFKEMTYKQQFLCDFLVVLNSNFKSNELVPIFGEDKYINESLCCLVMRQCPKNKAHLEYIQKVLKNSKFYELKHFKPDEVNPWFASEVDKKPIQISSLNIDFINQLIKMEVNVLHGSTKCILPKLNKTQDQIISLCGQEPSNEITQFQEILIRGQMFLVDIFKPKEVQLNDLLYALLGRNFDCIQYILECLLKTKDFQISQSFKNLFQIIVITQSQKNVMSFIIKYIRLFGIKFDTLDKIMSLNEHNILVELIRLNMEDAYIELFYNFLFKEICEDKPQSIKQLMEGLLNQEPECLSIQGEGEDVLKMNVMEYGIYCRFYKLIDIVFQHQMVVRFNRDLLGEKFMKWSGWCMSSTLRLKSDWQITQLLNKTLPIFSATVQLFMICRPLLPKNVDCSQLEVLCTLAPVWQAQGSIPPQVKMLKRNSFLSLIQYLIENKTFPTFDDFQNFDVIFKEANYDPVFVMFLLQQTHFDKILGLDQTIDEFCTTNDQIKRSPIYTNIWKSQQGQNILQTLNISQNNEYSDEIQIGPEFIGELMRQSIRQNGCSHPCVDYLLMNYPLFFIQDSTDNALFLEIVISDQVLSIRWFLSFLRKSSHMLDGLLQSLMISFDTLQNDGQELIPLRNLMKIYWLLLSFKETRQDVLSSIKTHNNFKDQMIQNQQVTDLTQFVRVLHIHTFEQTLSNYQSLLKILKDNNGILKDIRQGQPPKVDNELSQAIQNCILISLSNRCLKTQFVNDPIKLIPASNQDPMIALLQQTICLFRVEQTLTTFQDFIKRFPVDTVELKVLFEDSSKQGNVEMQQVIRIDNKITCHFLITMVLDKQIDNPNFNLNEEKLDQLQSALPGWLLQDFYKPAVEVAQQKLEQDKIQEFAMILSGVWDGVAPDQILLIYEQFQNGELFKLQDLNIEMKTQIEQDCKDLYKVEDLSAPHTNDNIRQSNQHASMLQSQAGQSQIMQSQILQQSHVAMSNFKEDFQFFLELLPDNTYQVRERRIKQQQQYQDDLVFSEFYYYQKPNNYQIRLQLMSQADFNKAFPSSAVVSAMISDLYQYNQRLNGLIQKLHEDETEEKQANKIEEKQNTITWPYYIENGQVKTKFELCQFYNIPRMRNQIDSFITQVGLQGVQTKETLKLQWRVSIVSFLEVLVSRCVESFQKRIKETRCIIKLLQNIILELDIYTVIDQIIGWKTLTKILNVIIYENLSQASHLLKVIRGVYVEFNEIDSKKLIDDSKALREQLPDGLDLCFRFGKTQYHLYKYMLIVRINVACVNPDIKLYDPSITIKQRLNNEQNIGFKLDELGNYLQLITNKFDFFEQLFSSEQVVSLLFNRIEIERQMLQVSKEISERFQKTMIISINFQSLYSNFIKQIDAAKVLTNPQLKVSKMEAIWILLEKLNQYFKKDAGKSLIQQVSTNDFEDLFLMVLQGTIEAVKDKVPSSMKLNSNKREFKLMNQQVKENKIMLEPLYTLNFDDSNSNKLQFVFGFQVALNYFLSSSKVGDVYLISSVKNGLKKIINAQIASKNRSSQIAYINISQKSLENPNTLQTRTTQQHNRYNRQMDDVERFDYELLPVDEIQQVILLSKIWPKDLMFNKNILNTFVIDGRSQLFLINEPQFVQSISELASQEDDLVIQDRLDEIFGYGKVNGSADLPVTSLIPFLPSHLQYDFVISDELKLDRELSHPPQLRQSISQFGPSSSIVKQQSFQQSQETSMIRIKLLENGFKVLPLVTNKLSTACHFEQNKTYQKSIIEFKKKFGEIVNLCKGKMWVHQEKLSIEEGEKQKKEGIKVLQRRRDFPFSEQILNRELLVQITFDDVMDSQPQYHVETVLSSVSVYECFVQGFGLYLQDWVDFPPLLKHSIQFMQSTSTSYLADNSNIQAQFKYLLFVTYINTIKFEYVVKDSLKEDDLLISYKDKTLTIVTISLENNRECFVVTPQMIAEKIQSIIYSNYTLTLKQPSSFTLLPTESNVVKWNTVVPKEVPNIQIPQIIRAMMLSEIIQSTIQGFLKSLSISQVNYAICTAFDWRKSQKSISTETDKVFNIKQEEQIIQISLLYDLEQDFSLQELIKEFFNLEKINFNKDKLTKLDEQYSFQFSQVKGIADTFVGSTYTISFELTYLFNETMADEINAYEWTLTQFCPITCQSMQVLQNEKQVTKNNVKVKFQVETQQFENPEKCYCLLVCNNYCLYVSQVIILPKQTSQQQGMLATYLKQMEKLTEDRQYTSIINQPLYFMIEGLSSKQEFHSQLAGGQITNKEEKYSFAQLFQPKLKTSTLQLENCSFVSQWVTENTVLVQVCSETVQNIQIYQQYSKLRPGLRFEYNKSSNTGLFKFVTLNQMSLKNTSHSPSKLNKIQFQASGKQVDKQQAARKKLQEAPLKEESPQKKLFDLLNQAADVEREDEIQIHKLVQSVQTDDSLQNVNFITLLDSRDQHYATRAGQKRTDIVTFRDTSNNEVELQKEEIGKFDVLFVHSVFPNIQYDAKLMKTSNYEYEITWQPIFKGIYILYIQSVKITTEQKLVVLANEIDFERTILEVPNLNKAEFFKTFQLQYQFKDQFGNLFGDIEQFAYSKGNVNNTEIKIQGKLAKIQQSQSILNKMGMLKVEFSFESAAMDENFEDEVKIQFLLLGRIKQQISSILSGVSLEKRQQGFKKELRALTNHMAYIDLKVRRMNFLEDILNLEGKNLKSAFTITFANEQGVDAGGLKREFYDMIGETMKDQRYKFFSPIPTSPDRYFFHQDVFKIKDRLNYFKVFGGLIANSILNEYIIGIDLIPPFYKVLYGEEILFSDLQQIMDDQTIKNYSSMKLMSDVELDSIESYFQIQVGKKVIDLVNNGGDVKVTKQNIDDYLNLVAKYYLQQRYQPLYDCFKAGFTSVMNIVLMKKWIKSNEISLFTQGLLSITYENLLNTITYSNAGTTLKAYFETYLQQSDPSILKSFLKFTTGSSSIPFDRNGFVISVQFLKMDLNKLPISHTCFKSIEIPMYQSFEQLKKKLDIAFTLGTDGFGFA